MLPRHRYDTHPMVRIPEAIGALEREHIAYRIIEARSAEDRALARWLEARFPFVGSGIQWSSVQDGRCVNWSKMSDLVPSFIQMAACVRSDVTVKVIWDDGLSPSLELTLQDAIRVAKELFDASSDTWIVCQSENWCFEVYHEGTLCFGAGKVSGNTEQG
jgi:hypothetical protein